ncbi:hypothetical protein BOX15_Mlig013252g1 [Macrostomum lignano]|uniref:Tub domain-containing protein n=2 Tax=Macrostomum lignano TaxID=282301 RepID=A0A1I8JF59_9PLAT|nr:hypothetical protein BOX15_Mlig013252g1 [Macrostomum lignano]
MHLLEETARLHQSDSELLDLSWMPHWDLDRPEDGWLACGNANGVVSVTKTCAKEMWPLDCEANERLNFNLYDYGREPSPDSGICVVEWNEVQRRLVTGCSAGVMHVWLNSEDGQRWSLELINDRPSASVCFRWSRSGSNFLMGSLDGLLLCGNFSDHQLWSFLVELGDAEPNPPRITAVCWSPGDCSVFVGTAAGEIMAYNSAGQHPMLHRIPCGGAVTGLEWNCPKFQLHLQGGNPANTVARAATAAMAGHRQSRPPVVAEEDRHADCRGFILAVALSDGRIRLYDGGPMSDSTDPVVCILTGLVGVRIQWSCSGEWLAAAGWSYYDPTSRLKVLVFDRAGRQLAERYCQAPGFSPNFRPPYPQFGLAWAHSDRRLFVSAGRRLYTIRVSAQVAPLTDLCARACPRQFAALNAPAPLRRLVESAWLHTLRGVLPPLSVDGLREFCSRPAPTRLHCTLSRCGRPQDEAGLRYVLQLEYLGGLVRLLVARRCGKLRPDFLILDPEFADDYLDFPDVDCDCDTGRELLEQQQQASNDSNVNDEIVEAFEEEEDDGPVDIGCASPKSRRRRRCQQLSTPSSLLSSSAVAAGKAHRQSQQQQPPPGPGLLRVSANLWGTRFGFVGLRSCLPRDAGSVDYRTSFLHMEPRRLTLRLVELGSSPAAAASFASASATAANPSAASAASDIGPSLPQVNPRRHGRVFSDNSPPLTSRGCGGNGGSLSDLRHIDSEDETDEQSMPAALAAKATISPAVAVLASSAGGPSMMRQSAPSTPSGTSAVVSAAATAAAQPPTSSIPSSRPAASATTATRRLRQRRIGDSSGQLANCNAGAASAAPPGPRVFVMTNKEPNWNEANHVYQLDFHGRVSLQSAKNFQLELDGQQVLQFGKTSDSRFSLDFQAPFSPVQAFSLALANLTQRLK